MAGRRRRTTRSRSTPFRTFRRKASPTRRAIWRPRSPSHRSTARLTSDGAMTGTVYEENVRMYLDFIDNALAEEPSLYLTLCATFARLLGPRLRDARVLDVACGE